MSNLIANRPNVREGLIQVRTNDDINAEIKAEHNSELEKSEQTFISGLAQHLRQGWSEAYDVKQEHEREMIKSLRQRKGEYEPDILAEIRKTGGTDVYLKLTDVKCRAAESWIRDIMLGQEDMWLIEPTEIPDISPEQAQAMFAQAQELVSQGYIDPATGQRLMFTPDEVQNLLEKAKIEIKKQMEQHATAAAERMAEKIKDQLQEGGFDKALREFVRDTITFKAGFIKGPIVARNPRLKWGPDFKPIVEDELSITVERLSPFDVYPSPTSTCINDGDIFIKHKMLPDQLYRMIGIKGNKEDAIRRILDLHGRSGLRGWLDYVDSEIDELEGKSRSYQKGGYIEALEFRGSVQGRLLAEWGVDESRIPDPDESYQVEAWLIQHEVIRCVLNADPLGRKPLYKASAVELPGSFWGMGIPELMEDCQRICNAAVRSLVDNMAAASGPQVALDPNALPDGESVTNIYPWKIWQIVQSHGGGGQLPINFFQPSMHSTELLQIYERFARYADDITGIPAYAYGSDAGSGAAKTASGLSMLMSAASKGIKQIVSNIDLAIRELVERIYIHNMLFDPDPSIKGDVNVVARGALAIMQKENQQLRRMEMMQMTNNPVDMQIIGIDGRAKMLREAFKTLDYTEQIVPSNEELAAMQMAMELQQDQQQMAQEQLPPEAMQ